MSDILGISVSGALAASQALRTTSHNIANANTPGFSRQKTDITAREPHVKGNGALGTGAIVNSIDRVYNEFVVNESRDLATTSASLNTNHEYTSQVDNMLADPESGLSPSIQSFFASMNGVADDPSSVSARQVMVSEAKSLADRFTYMDGRFTDLRRGMYKDMENTVADINSLAQAIAKINEAIVRAREIGGTDSKPNDLLDQRDQLLLRLSENVGVRASEQEDGRLNVFIGNGQTLVIGSEANKLSVVRSKADPAEREVVFESKANDAIITKFLSGGRLGGILEFKHGVLDITQNDLGRIAIGIAKTFNEQHQLGMDLKSSLGDSFFSEVDKTAPQIKPNVDNGGDLDIQATITDIDKLSVYDYRLSYNSGEYLLVRIQDDKLIGKFSSLPQSLDTEGFRLDVKSGSSIKEGDSYIIRPTREASERFHVMVSDVSKIAAASPIRASASIKNTGDGNIGQVEVVNTDPELFAKNRKSLETPIIVRFVDDTHFELLNNKGEKIKQKLSAVPDAPAIVADKDGKPSNRDIEEESAPGLLSTYSYDPRLGTEVFPTPDGVDLGIRFKITGNPKQGDMFRIEFNRDGVGDNANAVKLAALQTKAVLENGTGNYSQIYAQMVSRVGSKAHELDTSGKAQETLLRQANERRESISGVNLDEEAANIVRYQKMYKANAQMIATAKELFDTLINTFR